MSILFLTSIILIFTLAYTFRKKLISSGYNPIVLPNYFKYIGISIIVLGVIIVIFFNDSLKEQSNSIKNLILSVGFSIWSLSKDKNEQPENNKKRFFAILLTVIIVAISYNICIVFNLIENFRSTEWFVLAFAVYLFAYHHIKRINKREKPNQLKDNNKE